MKKHLNRSLCALLCSTLLANVPLGALSYTGLGTLTDIHRDTVGDGLYYSELVSTDKSGKTQRSYIFEYAPSGGTLPIVRWGSKVYGSDRLGTLVSSQTDEGSTVLGALNGDFYSLKTGVPLGVMIDGGRIISTDDSKYAIGFLENGSAIIGKPSIKMSLTVTKSAESAAEQPAESSDENTTVVADDEAPLAGDTTVTEDTSTTDGTESSENATEDIPTVTEPVVIEINHLNKYPTIWGVYMVTEDFAATTKSTVASREIAVEFASDITASGTVEGVVRDITDGGFNNPIPEGCTVITAAEGTAYAALLEGIEIGDSVSLTTVCAEGWDAVVTAIGGGDVILEGGVMPDGIIDEDHEKVVHPRTAVGIKADGTVVFFAVDGRTSSSRGLKIADLSALMSELGCVKALNLDGGGSTTVMVKASDETDCVYVNVPADTSYRGISNGILFISKAEADGVAAALSVYPKTQYLLTGSTLEFTAQALDAAYTPLGIMLTTEELTASLEGNNAAAGTVSGGAFTAGDKAGEYRVTLSADSGEAKISGEVSVLVIDEPDVISITPSKLRINPGSSVSIDISAKYMGKDVTVDCASFYYTLNGTHTEANSEQYPDAWLMCEYGYLDRNGNFTAFEGDFEGEVEIEITRGELTHTVNLSIGTAPDVIADYESPNSLGALKVHSGEGDLYIAYTTNARRSSGAFEMGFDYENANGEVLRLTAREQIPISPDAESIKLWIKGDASGTMSASVFDSDENEHTVKYEVTKDYSKQTGWREISAVIPEELKGDVLRLGTLLSISTSGSASRSIIIDDVQITYGGTEASPLTGISKHWAANYIYTLYDMGVIEDVDCEIRSDGIYYAPDKALSRGEFAKMLSIWLGYDASEYANHGVKLEDSTPEDKVPYIRAVIENGLMSGRGVSEDGKVIFDAGATITREEAFKVIGALIDGTEGELNFTDADKISDWARSGIAKCIAKGIISGYEDKTVRPKANISRAEFATILSKMS